MNPSASPSAPILAIRGLRKTYGDVQAVRAVDLNIPRGSIYGFLGPNGAGKTTTIRSIMNIIVPDGGEILFDGVPLTRERLDRIGYLPEERGLYRKMTCLDQLVFLGQLKSLERGDARKRGARWLERMGLAEWADRKVDALSKGMQQKVQLAATFMFDPDLVILDEPFSGLDPLNVEVMRDIIREEHARGCTIIFSTHMLAQAERLCDHICLIDGGEVVVDGTIDAVRDRFPQDSVRAAYPEGVAMPESLPGVARIERDENAWRLTLEPEADPQRVLDALRDHGPVSLFAARRPSLDEIFLTAVRQRRAAAKEATR